MQDDDADDFLANKFRNEEGNTAKTPITSINVAANKAEHKIDDIDHY